jgi:NAD(P)-dependent dehydrogenase (short-subunit alcohol dehydrogenase family)
MSYVADLDTKLLKLSSSDFFTLRDAFAGVHIFGGIGSGKTSGSGKAIAGALLRANAGGLVLCAKPDEVERWVDYARANGRANSVMLFGERGQSFNFIAYELARQGVDGLGSVVECLMRILDAARLTHPNAGHASQAFWDDAIRQLLRNTIPLLYAATGTVNVADIIRFVTTAPQSPEQRNDRDFLNSSFMVQTMIAATERPVVPLPRLDLEQIAAYWRNEYTRLEPKTRSNMAISLSTTLDRFVRGRLHRAFCTGTTLVPEMTFHGAIIIMDMSALTWNEDGIIGQQLFKFMWQRAVLARNGLEPNHRDRPVFLWADEAQYFVNAFDADYQSACRSAKAATIYLTQSLPTYYAKMGGENTKAKADMLLANFVTKVFHNNADPETNKWAAETIGRVLQRRDNYSEGQNTSRAFGVNAGENSGWNTGSSSGYASGQSGGTYNYGSSSGRSGGESWGRNRGLNTGDSTSSGYSETMDYEIEPGDFARRLRTGGPANRNNVTAVWFQAGRIFDDSRRNYLGVRFEQ